MFGGRPDAIPPKEIEATDKTFPLVLSQCLKLSCGTVSQKYVLDLMAEGHMALSKMDPVLRSKA